MLDQIAIDCVIFIKHYCIELGYLLAMKGEHFCPKVKMCNEFDSLTLFCSSFLPFGKGKGIVIIRVSVCGVLQSGFTSLISIQILDDSALWEFLESRYSFGQSASSGPIVAKNYKE